MDYIETLHFIGTKYTAVQSLQWPRAGVKIDGFTVTSSTIPDELVKAQCETALAIYNGNDPLQDRPRSVQSERVGDIEVHYMPGASSIVLPVKVNALLAKLVIGGGTGSFVVTKA